MLMTREGGFNGTAGITWDDGYPKKMQGRSEDGRR